jgi:hypothetical protein
LASLVPGPYPNTISSAESAKLASSGHEAELAQQALVVEGAGEGQQDASGGYALREIHEEQAVADGIAQADHQVEAEAGERQNGGQQHAVAGERAHAPPKVHGPECREKHRDPNEECAAELRGTPHHERRLQLAELFAGERAWRPRNDFRPRAASTSASGDAQAGDGAHVGQAAGGVVDAARHELPLGRFGEDGQVGQQVLAGGEIVQVQQLLVGEAVLDFGERARFGAVDQEEAEEQRERARQHPDGFAAAPDDALATRLAPRPPRDGCALSAALLRVTAIGSPT